MSDKRKNDSRPPAPAERISGYSPPAAVPKKWDETPASLVPIPHDHAAAVKQFMRGAGQPVADSPTLPLLESEAKARLRIAFEEAIELALALGFEVKALQYNVDGVRHLDFVRNPDLKVELPQIAKELADVDVVNTGHFAWLGIQPGPILQAVDENNLGKLPVGHLNADGKFIKPPGYPKPDIAALLRQQGWQG